MSWGAHASEKSIDFEGWFVWRENYFSHRRTTFVYSVLSMCGRCPRREQSAHVGASPPLSRSLRGRPPAPAACLCPPAEPPTPCVPRVYDCALFFSALHLASGAWRCWGPRRAGARFCFRGSRAMPLWAAAVLCGASGKRWPL
jgi:hypothetical protein